MPLITLTTDFGLRDGYVGAMKGVLYSRCPQAQVVDLAHLIPAHDVIHGAFALSHATQFFPVGTIHIGVIDPGVGGRRVPMCVECDGQYFVGPDNGLFAICAHQAKQWRAYQLTKTEYFCDTVSPTFHGRDIFAPVAAHLANGLRIEALGVPLPQPTRLEFPELTSDDDSIQGEVVYIDSFGNAVTNIHRENLPNTKPQQLRIAVDACEIQGLVTTYEDAAAGAPLALISSVELLEIAVRDGSAADTLGLTRGSPVRIATQG